MNARDEFENFKGDGTSWTLPQELPSIEEGPLRLCLSRIHPHLKHLEETGKVPQRIGKHYQWERGQDLRWVRRAIREVYLKGPDSRGNASRRRTEIPGPPPPLTDAELVVKLSSNKTDLEKNLEDIPESHRPKKLFSFLNMPFYFCYEAEPR